MDQLKQLRNLESTPHVAGTSRITIITPNMQVGKLRQFLTQELATAKNIKNRVNRQSVLSALTKLQAYAVTLKQLPSNGLAMYSESLI